MDCLLPVKSPTAAAEARVTVSPEESEGGEKIETSRSYTYRRRVAKRETGNWRGGGEDSGRERDEMVEEAVMSPDEVPEPFPVEEKQPDVIVFHPGGRALSVRPQRLPGRGDGTLAHRDVAGESGDRHGRRSSPRDARCTPGGSVRLGGGAPGPSGIRAGPVPQPERA